MKQSEPLLSKLPSLGELLKHPTVDRVVKRVNQTTVAQRAAGFLEELRTSLRNRDVAPSIHHLAERLARRLLGGSQTDFTVINATGVVCGEQWPAPLAQSALDEMLRLASEFHEAGPALAERVVESLRALTGAESAWISHSFEGAVRLAQECADGKLEVARYSGLLNPSDWGLAPFATVSERLAEGADVVVADGGGLLGGPRAGIVVGKRTALERIAGQSWARTLAADEMTLVALAATLDIYRSGRRVIHEIPMLQLLSAPLENLQQRAERLAQLMAAIDSVASAKPQAVESAWLQDAEPKFSGRSWVIALKLKSLSAEKATQAWRDTSPRLVARTVGDEIHLDLRSVFPRWDQQLVSAIENLSVVK